MGRGVAVLVWREGADGREWLLLHRALFSAEFDGDWAWSAPGGAIEPGEDADAAAARELVEETGLRIPCSRLDIDAGPVDVYVAEARKDAAPRLSAEHDRLEWVSTDEAVRRCLPSWVGALFEAVP